MLDSRSNQHPARRLSVGAALLAIIAALILVPTTRAEAAPTEHKFMSLNFCGSNCQGGSFAKIPTLASAIAAYRPAAVMLTEICRGQLHNLLSAASANGYPLQTTYTQLDGSRPGCANGAGSDLSFGNAILIPVGTGASFVNGTVVESPVYPGGMQRVTCVDTIGALAYRTTVCNTHISPSSSASDARILAEIREAARVAEAAGTGKPVVLGGDFNRHPLLNAMNSVYHQGQSGTGQPSAGRFEEIDQCGGANPRASGSGCNDVTFSTSSPQQKIDYIFLKQAYFRGLDGRVVNTDFGSDHFLIQGRATVCGTATC